MKRNPIVAWAVVCENGDRASHHTDERNAIRGAAMADKCGCGPHRVVKLVEERRKK